MRLSDIFPALSRFSDSRLIASNLRNEEIDLSFPELKHAVSQLANELDIAGFKSGSRIGLSLPNCYEFILWDLAALKLGGVLQVFPEGYQPSQQELADTGIPLWVHAGAITTEGAFGKVIDLSAGSAVPGLEGSAMESQPDLHSMVYSSGTSGYLKGLSISRKGTERLIGDFLESFSLSEEDSHLIFLPLSNYQQRLSVWACLHQGVDIFLTEYTQVFRELQNAKPSFIIAPPVIYENIYQLFSKQADCKRLVNEFLGGHMRFMITGMAPIKHSLLNAFNEQIGICLLEAYGVTETGMIAWNTPTENRRGTVGKAVHADEVTITGEGELLVGREYPLCLGYFQADSEDAANTFLSSGQIATGDMASVDADGYITLLGRKKDIVVTNAGIKFHPERVEKKLDEAIEIIKSVVLWDDEKNQLHCIVKVATTDDTQLLNRVINEVNSYNDTTESYMQIANLVAVTDEFSIENGLLTRNMKLNRKGFAQTYLKRLRSENLLTISEEVV